MKAKDLENLILEYTPFDNVAIEKDDKIIIPRMTAIVYNVVAATNKVPNEVSLHTLFHDYSLGAIKFNLDRSLRNIHLCTTLMESDKELPPIAASSGSADFVMGGIPFKICLNEAQFNELTEEFKNEVNCIVLEDWKANVKTVNGILLFTDISTLVLSVAEQIRQMMEKLNNESQDTNQDDAKGKEREQASIH